MSQGLWIRITWRTVCLGIVLTTVGLTTIQLWIPTLIYRPAPLQVRDPKQWGLGGSIPMQVRYVDGTVVTGWWSRPLSIDASVILLVHGRSDNIASRAYVMRVLAAHGLGVLMFDYRGYGASTGNPSEAHLVQDTLTAYRWLRDQGIPSRSIVVLGQSLGDYPASVLAAEQPVAALILVSPFTSLPDALAERLFWLPIRLVPWTRNRFDVASSLARFSGPTLLIASRVDGVVPIGNAERVRRIAARAQWLDVSPLHHNGLLQAIADDGRLVEAIRALTSSSTASSQVGTIHGFPRDAHPP
jgi:pimeloyl-ACP methyl ester carboxylesterase